MAYFENKKRETVITSDGNRVLETTGQCSELIPIKKSLQNK